MSTNSSELKEEDIKWCENCAFNNIIMTEREGHLHNAVFYNDGEQVSETQLVCDVCPEDRNKACSVPFTVKIHYNGNKLLGFVVTNNK